MSKPNIEDIYPLSPGQQGMLMVLLLAGARSEVYFDQCITTLSGELDAALWRRAWQGVVDRHPSLRSLFLWERREQPLQVVRREAELPCAEHDWSALAEAEREARLHAFLAADRARGFDLGRPPLMRLALIRWSAESWKFVWSFHHLIVDGWSLSRVFGEAIAGYAALRAGREPELEAPRRYRDYIAWLQRQDLGVAETFWRGALAGFDTPTPLPYDGSGAGGESWEYGRETDWLPADETAALAAAARHRQLTLNTLFQGAWGTLLGRATRRSDVIFGSVVAGRPGEVEGIESMVGFFINVLPVRMRVGSRTAAAELSDLQRRQSEQRDFEYCPLETLQAWSEIPRGTRLIESLLVFQNFPLNPLEVTDLPGFRIADSQVAGATHYPVTLYVAPRAEGLDLRLDYHASRLDAGSARQLLAHLRTVLAAFAADLEVPLAELPLLTAEERRELLAAAAGPPAAAATSCIHTLFAEQAARTPAAPAVEAGGRGLTYGELDEQASRLASRLRRLGVGPETIVGLCAERSPEMVVGMLGVLRAGGAYLPLDPAYPRERLAFMVEDSGARVLITQESLLGSVPAEGREIVLLNVDEPAAGNEPAAIEPQPLPGNGAYVIYTSGSTGRPKGVVVPHSALVNYVRGAAEDAGIGPGDRVLQFASMSFDTSAEEIYPCLTRGATLVLRDEAMAGSAETFLPAVERLKITVLDLPTAYWHELVAGMAAQRLPWPAGVRLVILGGEQAQAAQVEAWRELAGEGCRLLNTYGPTEATIVTTRRDLSGARDFPGEVPVGRPVPGARVHVVSPDLQPLPTGLDGELAIGGHGLARGYLGRPDLTAERFVPDPFADTPGERLYRTGDLARRLRSGELEFRGRLDHQVKIRGFRVELGEIEAALRAIAGIRDAAVLVREDEPGDRRLAAYLVPSGEPALALSALRAQLRESLPEYMLPAAFVVLAALPLTSSGKVDRRALPPPGEAARLETDEAFAAPRNPVEEMLAGIFAEVLKLDRVGVQDDFFVLGGHSLLVAQVASRVRQALGAELPIVEIFRRPTVAALAERIGQGGGEAELPELPSVRRVPRDGRPIPLSFPQERVWVLDQLAAEGNIAYNFQVTLTFHGPLDVSVLERTFSELVRRHEILRTSFPTVDGRPVQVIHPPAPVRLPVVDLRGVPAAAREAAAEALVAETVAVPFDVTRAPLIRWRLLRLEEQVWMLIQVEQHFVHDGWSYAVLLRELKALYSAFLRGEPSPLPELPVQYADFAHWQRQWLEGAPLERLREFWRRKLADRPAPAEIATDRPRPARNTFRGDVQMFPIPPELYGELRRFSRRQGFTLYMTMLAGFFSLLHRYTGQEDLLIGTTNANRRAREIEGLIGMVVNTLLLRGDLAGRPTFRELLGRVRELTLEVYSHQDMPFEKLVQELRPERQLGRNPLFQIMYNFHDAAVPDLEFGGLRVERRVRSNRSAKLDLQVIVVPRGEQRVGLEEREEDRHAVLHWEYNTDLFDLETMQRMVGHYLTLLAGIARDPGQRLFELPLLSPAESLELLRWNDTAEDFGSAAPLHRLIEAQAARTPEAVAVEFEGERLTYRELDQAAGRLAERLRLLGLGPEPLVGLAMERSPELVVALMGILKAGAAYVPLDPAYPRERLAYMLQDSGVRVLLTQERLLGSLPAWQGRLIVADGLAAAEAGPVFSADVELDGLAYMIYTSGSTGRPKGALNTHRGIANRLLWMQRQYGLTAADVVLQKTPFSFDVSVWEFFWPLMAGARLLVAPPGAHQDPAHLVRLIADGGVTTLHFVPSMLQVFLEQKDLYRCAALRRVLCSGEALPHDLQQRFFARLPAAVELHNLYGPTEAAVDVTYWACDPQAPRVPIGRPVANTHIHLLDRELREVPVGVPGELYIGGVQLARGYHRRPELTAERFVPDPAGGEPGGHLYRTGDLARRLPDGAVDYLGRLDFQVKVRGFRIELGEIESALAEHPEVREAVVLARPAAAAGDLRLVGYVVPVDGAPLAGELRDFLARRLPEHMVPTELVLLDRMPLTPSGKVDRRALPGPEPSRRQEDGAAYLAPRNPAEMALAGIWSEVLGVEQVGVRDDFFALGGHSLSAARVLARVRDLFQVELALPVAFERRTVERLAELIAACEPAAAAGAEPALAGEALDGLMAHAATLSDAELDSLLAEMMEGGTR